MTHTILLTDGEQRATLALARAFGRAGHRVVVCGSRRHTLAGASRYTTVRAEVPDVLDAPEGFAAAIERVLTETGADTLIPVSDAAALALLPRQERLRGVVIPFPPIERFRQLADKARQLQAAFEVGIAIPGQRAITSATELAAAAAEKLRFPLVIKPTRSVVGSEVGRRKVSVSYASNEAELVECLGQYPLEAFPVLLQQRILGPGVGIFLLVWEGQVYASFAHRRLREKPPSGGVSVYRESVLAPPALVEQSKTLLDRFGWQGVAMIEYKIDRETGTPYLMEINGRFWGSLQLALDAGVDFPNLLLALAHGKRPAPVRDYRIGVRSRWWWGDVDHLLARLRRSDDALDLPPGEPTRLGAAIEFLKLWRPGDRNEILRLDDPMPFVRETLEWLRGR